MTMTTIVLVTIEGVFDATRPYTRSDLVGQLPIVYNGKTAEEWHFMWAQLALKKLERSTFAGKTAKEWYDIWQEDCSRGLG